MTKELTTKKSTELTNKNMTNDLGISITDIELTRLKLLQSSSDLVKEGEGVAGQIVDLDTMEVLGDRKNPLEFAIVGNRKMWLEDRGEEYTVRPATHKNELPWEEAGVKRTYFHSFYVVLKKDVEEAKGGLVFPYELSFSATGLKAASIISKLVLKLGMMGQHCYSRYFTANVVLKKKGKHSWLAIMPKIGEATPKDKQKSLASMAELMKTANIQSPTVDTAIEGEHESKF